MLTLTETANRSLLARYIDLINPKAGIATPELLVAIPGPRRARQSSPP